MTQKIKQIIIAVIIIIVAFFAIRSFTREPVADNATTSEGPKSEFIDGREIVILLNKLSNVELKGSIFASQVFLSLYNFEQEIPNETPGRKNPFAPLGTANLTVGTSTRISATTTPAATTTPSRTR